MYELVNFGLVLECNSEIEEKTKNDKKESNKTTKQESHAHIKVNKKAINPKQG